MQASTLVEVMKQRAGDTSSQSALHCWNVTKREYFPVSYAALSQRAFAFGAKLIKERQNPGVATGVVVMIACHSPYATLVAFHGAISIGAIPMIFPMPLSLGSNEALSERIEHWGFAFEEPAMLVLEDDVSTKILDEIPSDIAVIQLSDNPEGIWDRLPEPASDHKPSPGDVAFFQTTSSSTGDHKAVAISHANIIANVLGIRNAAIMDGQEKMITWLPLFHDMGLVGTVLFCFVNNYPLFIMTPTQFVKRPALWLKGMHEHHCTIATAPNFGFDYCARLISDKDVNEMDLRHVKHLFIGAEPIRVSTIESFIRKFKPCGITPQVIRPAYGLAESTIITSISSTDKPAQFVCLDADTIGMGESVTVLDTLIFSEDTLTRYDADKSIAVCTAGTAIAGMKIDIIDEDGGEISEEGVAGEIAITGTSVAMGYVGGGDKLISHFPNGRLPTGDMGAIMDGELYILERIKNIIIRSGENFLVSSLEERLSKLMGVSHEHVAVFETNIHDPNSEIVVLVERYGMIPEHDIDALLVAMPKDGFSINRILLSKSREIPRTTSGKKRHFYCRKLYQKSEIKYQQSIEVSPERIVQAMNNESGNG